MKYRFVAASTVGVLLGIMSSNIALAGDGVVLADAPAQSPDLLASDLLVPGGDVISLENNFTGGVGQSRDGQSSDIVLQMVPTSNGLGPGNGPSNFVYSPAKGH